MATKDSSFLEAKRAFGLFGFLLVVWGFYRLVFRLPEQVEELVIKPIIWLGAVYFLLIKEKRGWKSVGWTGKNLFKSLYLGFGLGMIFAIEGVVVNALKYGTLNFGQFDFGQAGFLAALGLSVATAVSEETVFRGYILGRLYEVGKDKWFAILSAAGMFVLVHLPIWLFVLSYTSFEIVLQSVLLFVFAVGSGWLYLATGSLVGPVLIHVVWGWSILLFR